MSAWPISESLSRVVLDSSLKVTLLLFASQIACWWLRRSSAALRHRIWALACVGLIAIPALAGVVPSWNLPLRIPRSFDRATTVINAPSQPVATVALPSRQPLSATRADSILLTTITARHLRSQSSAAVSIASTQPIAAAGRIGLHWSTRDLFLVLWATGTFVTALPTLLGLIINRRVRRESPLVTSTDWTALLSGLREADSIRRTVELRQSKRTSIPLTWGQMRPVILLPEEADSWPASKRRLVLLHELAHIRRFDFAFHLIGRIGASFYWFHPLAWVALRSLRLEAEKAADDCVVQYGERPDVYARQLLEIAQSVRKPRASMAVGLAMARRNTLEERMIAMFDEARSHSSLGRRSGRFLSILAALLVVGLAAVQARPQQNNVASPSQTKPNKPIPDAKPGSKALPPGPGRITGRVVIDAGGKPAPGATVILLMALPKGEEYYYGKLPLVSTTADTDGRFAFDKLGPGKYGVWANLGSYTSRQGKRHGERPILKESGEGAEPVELRLTPAPSVDVTVKAKATGQPIANAKVDLGWSDFPDNMTTDANGKVAVEPLTPDRWLVQTWAEGYASESRWVNLENGADAAMVFLLEPGGTIEGKIVDPAGKPVEGVEMAVEAKGRSLRSPYLATDKEGRYRMEYLPRGIPLELSYSKTEYVRKSVSSKLTSDDAKLELTIEPIQFGGSIQGIVLDPMKRPVADATLTNVGSSSADERKTKTGPDGRFFMEKLFENHIGTKIAVQAKGFAPARVQVKTGLAGSRSEITINLEAGHRVRGKVVDEKGRPISGANVYYAHGNQGFSNGGRGITDAEGMFTFESLPPDTPFAFSRAGFSDIQERKLPLDTDELVTVTMVPSGTLDGTVVDVKTGKPVEAFNVKITYTNKRKPGDVGGWLRGDLSKPGQNCQSPEGRFKIKDLMVGMPLQVTISAQGYESTVIDRYVVPHPDDNPVMEFPLLALDPSTLRAYAGRLVDSKGQPLANAELRLIAAGPRQAGQRRTDFPFNWEMIENGQLADQPIVERFLEATTDAEGRFRFEAIPREAEVELAWWGTGIAPGRADHQEELAEANKESIEIAVPAAAKIVGKVSLEDFPNAGHFSIGTKNDSLKPGQTDFEVADLAPGDYTILLSSAYTRSPTNDQQSQSTTLASRRVTLHEGETLNVEFKK